MRGRKKTNPKGGKGKGRGGRNTFIDEIISKAETSQRLSSQKLKSQQSLQTNYETKEVVSPKIFEELVEDIEEPVEDIKEPIEDVEEPTENIEDKASAAGE